MEMIELWREPRVLQVVGYARSTIWQKVKAGEFPKPVPIGPRAVAWPSNEVQEWVRQRIEAARQRAA